MSTTNVLAFCATHADRPAYVRCQRCDEPACTDCMVQAPVGFQCRRCVSTTAAAAPRIIGAAIGRPYLTWMLLAVNVAVGLASLTQGDWVSGRAGPLALDYGFLGGGVNFEDGTLKFIGVDNGEWYRIFTGAFLHGGALHLGFNMLALWQVGTILEPRLGRVRFGLLCLVSLLGGSFGGLLVAPERLGVGASGMVFGLMGALFVAERLGMLGLYRSGSIGVFLAINLVLTFAIPGISIGGHIGGLIAGAAAGLALFEFERRRLPATLPVAVTLGTSLVLFVGCFWAASLWMDPLF